MAISMTISITDAAKVMDVFVSKEQGLGFSTDHGIVNLYVDGGSVSLWTSPIALRALTVQLAGAANEMERKLALRNGTPVAAEMDLTVEAS